MLMDRALACCCSCVSPGASHSKTLLPGMKNLDPVEQTSPLVYKPYLEFLCCELLQFAPSLQALPLDANLAFKCSSSPRNANVYNWLYSSPRLRRIRMTYFDAGRACQAFNALLYPCYEFDLPLLGIDLLSFGASKILCVVDFIPLSQDPSYQEKYIDPLALFRQPFSAHCSEMSDRFFDKDKFASEQMVFYRSNLGIKEPELQVPGGGMYRVYTQYVASYLKALQFLDPIDEREFKSKCQDHQFAYDQYLAERDPAFKVFSSYFGREWTHKFCGKFLCPGLTTEVI